MCFDFCDFMCLIWMIVKFVDLLGNLGFEVCCRVGVMQKLVYFGVLFGCL